MRIFTLIHCVPLKLSYRFFPFRFLTVLVLYGFIPIPLLAEQIPPYNMYQSITVNYDKSGTPAPQVNGSGVIPVFWGERGGIDTENPGRWNTMSWLCFSAVEPLVGACSNSTGRGPTKIILKVTEERSKVTSTITLYGYKRIIYHPGASCGYYGYSQYQMPTSIALSCYGILSNGSALWVYINPIDLLQLPTGGIWRGTLKLKQINRTFGHWAFTSVADITLNMTDKNNGQIFLPAFGTATPLVDLNLRTTPLSTAPGGQVSGGTTIDTCLYDGYNSNSPWLTLTLSDTAGITGRAADIFSVIKEGTAGTTPTERVDYRVRFNYNGQEQKAGNGKDITLNGVNTANIRPVALPGYRVPVVCIPAPLKLDVQPFAKASKTAGRYSGTLRIKLAANTLAP